MKSMNPYIYKYEKNPYIYKHEKNTRFKKQVARDYQNKLILFVIFNCKTKLFMEAYV